MAAAEILATGNTDASSSDTTLTATFTLVALKAADNDAKVFVEVQDDESAYTVIDQLTTSHISILLPPGIYRFTRPAGPSCGVFQAA